tara:strand:+ start:2264 stop:2539 length:276 start_codon:yes stop_codon:yes gene_type:complete
MSSKSKIPDIRDPFIIEFHGDHIRKFAIEALKEEAKKQLRPSLRECTECFGSGESEHWCDDVNGLGEHTTRHWVEECKTCNGTGEVEQDES